MNIFGRQKGTVSVFLTLMLVPTLMISGLVTDAARVYGSRSIISDAGMLAMNAGLTYYDSDLKDHYGLLSLGTAAADLDIEDYFIRTIRASGLEGAEDVSRLVDLQLSDGSFSVTGVDGSQIYMTEVEKTQILEYMKYRAPVVIADELWNKLNEIMKLKQEVDILKKQTQFASKMEDLQDACESAKTAIEKYVDYEGDISAGNVNEVKKAVKSYMETGTTRLLAADSVYPLDSSIGLTTALDGFSTTAAEFKKDFAKRSDDTVDTLFEYFDYYLTCTLYQQVVLTGYKSGSEKDFIIKRLQDECDMKKADAEEAYKKYSADSDILETYRSKWDGETSISDGVTLVSGKYAEFEKAEELLGKALTAVNSFKKKFEEAQKSYNSWSSAVADFGSSEDSSSDDDADDDDSFQSSQAKSVEKYKGLFEDKGADEFIQKIGENQTYISAGKAYLEQISYMEQQLKDGSTASGKIAQSIKESGYTTVTTEDEVKENSAALIKNNYVEPSDDFAGTLNTLKDDDFYTTIKDLCETDEETGTKKEGKKQASKIFSMNSSSEDDSSEDDDSLSSLANANWDGIAKPSDLIASEEDESSDDEITTLDSSTDVSKKSSRKNALENVEESFDQMTELLSSIESLLSSGIEDLYLTEYAMQMFSYYTVDKDDGKTIKEVTSLSGDDLTKHKMYKSEAEYILWGQDEASENVKRTRLLMYGIRFIFNLIFAFSDGQVAALTEGISAAVCAACEFLEPVVNVLLKFGVAAAEAASDVSKLMKGKNVPLLKQAKDSIILSEIKGIGDSVIESETGTSVKDADKAIITMNYKEYLSLFMAVRMMGGLQEKALGRIADCIQLNEDLDITTSYTMIAIKADVKVRTTFLRKASAWSGGNSISSDYYTVSYKSCLGY